mmetsp:Transcript_2694/g.7488  ORF Transcript_2694/g.7488 Transcript_2694/m.7488 type:complete len:104 (+) Transcript_2694:137-448(+)
MMQSRRGSHSVTALLIHVHIHGQILTQNAHTISIFSPTCTCTAALHSFFFSFFDTDLHRWISHPTDRCMRSDTTYMISRTSPSSIHALDGSCGKKRDGRSRTP